MIGKKRHLVTQRLVVRVRARDARGGGGGYLSSVAGSEKNSDVSWVTLALWQGVRSDVNG